MAVDIRVESVFDGIKITMDGYLYVYVVRSKMLGLTSWRHGENNYFVEFVMESGGLIRCEFDEEQKWKDVLSGLGSLIYGKKES